MWTEFFQSLSAQIREQLHQKEFVLPVVFDLGATFFFALTGALAAIRRGYDWVGLFALAMATGLGGGLMRDGLFIQAGPPAMVTDGRFLIAVAAACVVGAIVASHIERMHRAIALLDAVGLGAYGAVGVQKALSAGLSIPAAILVGVINACGGGVLRDVLVREEPLVLKPGQFYAVAAALGCVLFITLIAFTPIPVPVSALIAAAVTSVFRVLTIVFKWHTSAVRPWFSSGGKGDGGVA
jgi:uncharacterized membrane protein YeiH